MKKIVKIIGISIGTLFYMALAISLIYDAITNTAEFISWSAFIFALAIAVLIVFAGISYIDHRLVIESYRAWRTKFFRLNHSNFIFANAPKNDSFNYGRRILLALIFFAVFLEVSICLITGDYKYEESKIDSFCVLAGIAVLVMLYLWSVAKYRTGPWVLLSVSTIFSLSCVYMIITVKDTTELIVYGVNSLWMAGCAFVCFRNAIRRERYIREQLRQNKAQPQESVQS